MDFEVFTHKLWCLFFRLTSRGHRPFLPRLTSCCFLNSQVLRTEDGEKEQQPIQPRSLAMYRISGLFP